MKNMRPLYLLIVAVACFVASCERVTEERIPAYPVNVNLGTTAYWVTYGVHSYGEYNKFIRETGTPANFPFTANTYTGFGGILLISGFNFETQDYTTPLAYDLACPVEAKNSVRINVDAANYEAVCPQCGSRYNIIEGGGTPVSGEALSKKYGLRRYSVRTSTSGGYTIVR